MIAMLLMLFFSETNLGFAAVSLGGSAAGDTLYSIHFDTLGIENPTFSFPLGDTEDQVFVAFGTHFVGQSIGPHNMMLQTQPLADLRLAEGKVSTLFDFSNPMRVALGSISDDTLYSAPLAVLFNRGVDQVGFDLGHLDVGTDAVIEAFDAQGNSLGRFSNLDSGHNSYSVTDVDGRNSIAGISIYVPEGGMDWEGFALNNVNFAIEDEDRVIPEPATIVVWSLLAVMGGVASVIHNRRKR